MNRLVAAADDHAAVDQRGRRVIREVAARVGVAPDDLPRAHVDPEHVRIERAHVRAIAGHRRRRSDVRAEPHLEQHLAVGEPHGAEALVAPGEVDHAVLHGRRGMDGAVGLQLPAQLARAAVERVQMHVVRPDQHEIAGNDRRRLHFAFSLERPEPAAVARVDGVQHAGEVADEHGVVPDGRRRTLDEPVRPGRVLPPQLAGLEIDGEQLAFRRSDVHDAVDDGRRRADRLAGFERPAQRQRARQRSRRDARQLRGAAELRPTGGGCLRRGRYDAEQDRQRDRIISFRHWPPGRTADCDC